MSFIPVNEPSLNGNEARYLQECIDTGWISSEGPFVRRFEEEFSARVGRGVGIAVCNGTAALEVAVVALDIGPGDEVILPTFTIISCVSAVIRAGATPVLVDCDPHTWNMDVGQVIDCVTPRTKAIMVVHIYGLPVDMDPILAIAQQKGIKVIEDAAEAHGLEYKGRPCGSMGDISVFSFYPNKLVTTGEGGMLVTDDEALANRCRSLINLCFQPQKRFVHEDLGWNYRMSNLQAAVGCAQLEQLERFIVRKREIGQRYTQLLGDISSIQLPLESTAYARNMYWVYGVVMDDDVPLDAPAMMQRLAVEGVGTRPFFWPMHEQPVLQKMGLFQARAHPVAERLARRGFYIPSGLALSDRQIEGVAVALASILK